MSAAPTPLSVFSGADAIEKLRPFLWNFLRASAASHDVGTYVEAVWKLSPGQFEELVATHLALLETTSEMLDGVAAVLPRLPASVRRAEQELVGVVHGPVDWPKTQLRRVATADPTLFVCRPAERRYDTPPARLAHAALKLCADLGSLSGVGNRGIVGTEVHQRVDHARRLLRHPKISGMRAAKPPRAEATTRLLARWPQLRAASNFLERVDAALSQHDEDVLQAVFEERVLAPATPDDLFELLVLFEIMDTLKENYGFAEIGVPTLVSDTAQQLPLSRLTSEAYGEAEIWWDRSIWTATSAKASNGRLWPILHAAGMTRQPFRPDITLHLPDMARTLIVEAKVTASEGVAAERQGIQEALAYLHDAQPLFEGQPYPHAAVVAWNATGSPPHSGTAPESLVGDQHQVTGIVSRFMNSLPAPP